MKEKLTPHIIAVGAFVAFIVLGLACASAPDGSYGGSSGGSSGYTQSSVNTARVISQYSIGLASIYSPVPISDQIFDIVYSEILKLEQEFTVTPLTSDEWNNNSWRDYIVKLAINNRTWYLKDMSYVYRTNLTSNTGKKYVVFTCIRKGNYYTDTLELTTYDYTNYAYEIN